MKEFKFKRGDYVRARYGGPVMMVVAIGDPDGEHPYFECYWFSADGNRRIGCLEDFEIDPVPPELASLLMSKWWG